VKRTTVPPEEPWVDGLERNAARRCADAVAALQAVSYLLAAGEQIPRAGDLDPALRLLAAVEAVQVAERAVGELRVLVVELAIDHGAPPAAVGADLDD
jgi:hypothetical protein